MAKRPPERLAAALKANLRRRKASTMAEAPESGPPKSATASGQAPPKDPQDLKDKAGIPARRKG